MQKDDQLTSKDGIALMKVGIDIRVPLAGFLAP